MDMQTLIRAMSDVAGNPVSVAIALMALAVAAHSVAYLLRFVKAFTDERRLNGYIEEAQIGIKDSTSRGDFIAIQYWTRRLQDLRAGKTTSPACPPG